MTQQPFQQPFQQQELQTNDEPAEKEKEFTHYVHLSNGDVVKAHSDDFQDGVAPTAWRDGGSEFQVIGVYPKEVNVDE